MRERLWALAQALEDRANTLDAAGVDSRAAWDAQREADRRAWSAEMDARICALLEKLQEMEEEIA